jgi:hypothetical protein
MKMGRVIETFVDGLLLRLWKVVHVINIVHQVSMMNVPMEVIVGVLFQIAI